MDYTIDMRLVRIKSASEIDREIEEGIYNGETHIYEPIFQDNKSEIDSPILNTNFADTELESKTKLKGLPIDSFSKISTRFDSLVPGLINSLTNLDKPFLLSAQDTLNSFNDIGESAEFKHQAIDTILNTNTSLSKMRKTMDEQFSLSWKSDEQSLVDSKHLREVKTFQNYDIDYAGTISKHDSRISKLAMFDEISQNIQLKPESARDFYQAFEWDTAKFNGNKFLDSDISNMETVNFRPPTQSELVFKAMQTMVDAHAKDAMGVSDENVSKMNSQHKFEKTLFAYRMKEDGFNKSFEEQLSATNDPREKESLMESRNNMQKDSVLLKDIADKLSDSYTDYKLTSLNKTLRDDFVIHKVDSTESSKNDVSIDTESNRVDYSHNETFTSILEKGKARREAEKLHKEYKPNDVFSLESMVVMMDANKMMLKSIKLRPSESNYAEATVGAFSNLRGHNSLMKQYEGSGYQPKELDIPRDFFSNTKYFESIPSFGGLSARENTTGEYLAHYMDARTRSQEMFGNGHDSIIEQNISKGINEGYSNMARTHKSEIAKADYDQVDTVTAKHDFERGFFEWQEQNSFKPDAQKDIQGLKDVHALYENYMEKATGLTVKPSFTVEDKAQELLKKGTSESVNNSALKPKSKTEELIASLRSDFEKPNQSKNNEVQSKKAVQGNIAVMRQKMTK